MRKNLLLSLMTLFYGFCFTTYCNGLPQPSYKPAMLPGNIGVYIGKNDNNVYAVKLDTSVNSSGTALATIEKSSNIYEVKSSEGNGLSLNNILVDYFVLIGSELCFPTQVTTTDQAGNNKTKNCIGKINLSQGDTGGTITGAYSTQEVPFAPHFFVRYGDGLLNINSPTESNNTCSADFFINSNNSWQGICNFKLSNKCNKLLGVTYVDNVSETPFIIISYVTYESSSTYYTSGDEKVLNKQYADTLYNEIFMLPDLVKFDSSTMTWGKTHSTASTISSSSCISNTAYTNYSGITTDKSIDNDDPKYNPFTNWYIGGFPNHKSATCKNKKEPSDYTSNENKYGLCIVANKILANSVTIGSYTINSDAVWSDSGFISNGTDVGGAAGLKTIFYPFNVDSSGTKVSFGSGEDTGLIIPNGSVGDDNNVVSGPTSYDTLRIIVFDCFSSISQQNNINTGSCFTPVLYSGCEGVTGVINTGAYGKSAWKKNPNVSTWIANRIVNTSPQKAKVQHTANTGTADSPNIIQTPPLDGIIMGFPPYPKYCWWYYTQAQNQKFWGSHIALSLGTSKSTGTEHDSSYNINESESVSVSFSPPFCSISASTSEKQKQSWTHSSSTGVTVSENYSLDPRALCTTPSIGFAVFLNSGINLIKTTMYSGSSITDTTNINFGSNSSRDTVTAYIPAGIATSSYEIVPFDMNDPASSTDYRIQYLFKDFASDVGITKVNKTLTGNEKFGFNNPSAWKTFGENYSTDSNWENCGAAKYTASSSFGSDAATSGSVNLSKSGSSSSSRSYSFEVSSKIKASVVTAKFSVGGGFSNTYTTSWSSNWSMGLTYDTDVSPSVVPNISGSSILYIPGSDSNCNIIDCPWITANMRTAGMAPWLLTYNVQSTGQTMNAAGNPLSIPGVPVNQPAPQAGQIYAGNKVKASQKALGGGKVSKYLVLLDPPLQPIDLLYNKGTYELIITNGIDSKSGDPVFYYVTKDGIYNSENSAGKSQQNTYYCKTNNSDNINNFVTSILPDGVNTWTVNFYNSASETIKFYYDKTDSQTVVLYNNKLWTISKNGLTEFSLKDKNGNQLFTTVNSLIDINNDYFYLATNKGLFYGSGINDKLKQNKTGENENITGLSIIKNILSFTATNSSGTQTQYNIYTAGNPSVTMAAVPKKGGILKGYNSDGNLTSYGTIQQVLPVSNMLSDSKVYLCLVSDQSGQGKYYLATPYYLCSLNKALSSDGGSGMLQNYSALLLSDNVVKACNTTTAQQNAKTICSDSNPMAIFTANVLSNNTVSNKKLGLVFYYSSEGNFLLAQSSIKDSDGNTDVNTYLITKGFIENQIVYTSLINSSNEPLIDFEIQNNCIAYKDGILYIANGQNIYAYIVGEHNIWKFGNKAFYKADSSINELAIDSTDMTMLTASLSNKSSVNFNLLITTGQGTQNTSSLSTIQNDIWEFQFFPQFGILQLATNDSLDSPSNGVGNPFVAEGVSMFSPPSKTATGEPLRNKVFLAENIADTSQSSMAQYTVNYQKYYVTNDSDSTLSGYYYNTIMPIILSEGYYSAIMLTAENSSNDISTNVLLNSSVPINSFFVYNNYIYINYYRLNQNTVYVYSYNKNEPSELVASYTPAADVNPNVINYMQMTDSSASGSYSINQKSYTNSKGKANNGSNQNYYSKAKAVTDGYNNIQSGSGNLPVGNPESWDEIVTDQSTASVTTFRADSINNQPAGGFEHDAFVIQDSISLAEQFPMIFENTNHTNLYLVLTTDGNLFFWSNQYDTLGSGSLVYQNNGTPCTSIAYNSESDTINAIIGVNTVEFSVSVNSADAVTLNVNLPKGSSLNVASDLRLDKNGSFGTSEYQLNESDIYNFNPKNKSSEYTITTETHIFMRESGLYAYLTDDGNVWISDRSLKCWYCVYDSSANNKVKAVSLEYLSFNNRDLGVKANFSYSYLVVNLANDVDGVNSFKLFPKLVFFKQLTYQAETIYQFLSDVHFVKPFNYSWLYNSSNWNSSFSTGINKDIFSAVANYKGFQAADGSGYYQAIKPGGTLNNLNKHIVASGLSTEYQGYYIKQKASNSDDVYYSELECVPAGSVLTFSENSYLYNEEYQVFSCEGGLYYLSLVSETPKGPYLKSNIYNKITFNISEKYLTKIFMLNDGHIYKLISGTAPSTDTYYGPTYPLTESNWPFMKDNYEAPYYTKDFTVDTKSQSGSLYDWNDTFYIYSINNGTNYGYYNPVGKYSFVTSQIINSEYYTKDFTVDGNSMTGSLYEYNSGYYIYSINNGADYGYYNVKSGKLFTVPKNDKLKGFTKSFTVNGNTVKGSICGYEDGNLIYSINNGAGYGYYSPTTEAEFTAPELLNAKSITVLSANNLGQQLIKIVDNSDNTYYYSLKNNIFFNHYQVDDTINITAKSGKLGTIEDGTSVKILDSVIPANGYPLYLTDSGYVFTQDLTASGYKSNAGQDDNNFDLYCIFDIKNYAKTKYTAPTGLSYDSSTGLISFTGGSTGLPQIITIGSGGNIENCFGTAVINKSGDNVYEHTGVSIDYNMKDDSDIILFIYPNSNISMMSNNVCTFPVKIPQKFFELNIYMIVNESNWKNVTTSNNIAYFFNVLGDDCTEWKTSENGEMISSWNSSNLYCLFNGKITDNVIKNGSQLYLNKETKDIYPTKGHCTNMYIQNWKEKKSEINVYNLTYSNITAYSSGSSDYEIYIGDNSDGVSVGTLDSSLSDAALVYCQEQWDIKVYLTSDGKYIFTSNDKNLSSKYDFSKNYPNGFAFGMIGNIGYSSSDISFTDPEYYIMTVKNGSFYDILLCVDGQIVTLVQNSLYNLQYFDVTTMSYQDFSGNIFSATDSSNAHYPALSISINGTDVEPIEILSNGDIKIGIDGTMTKVGTFSGSSQGGSI